nr:nickel pincer cofactor biosynthesis protein LarC [uncultured Anaerostipes sp.]
MNKTLYLDCSSGISGDMFVGALLDLGVDEQKLQEALKSLSVNGFEVKISRKKKAGLDGCDFDVILDAKHKNHDHDMEYLHGHTHHHNHSHEEGHGHHHDHGHHHHGAGHGHHHEHRGLLDILEIIRQSGLTEGAKKIAEDIFKIIAEAEAKAHGESIQKVHFHEVGAVDSIADICAAAFCLDDLGIQDVIIPQLYEGSGTVRCQHGVLPIPVPAVVNIVSAYNLTLRMSGVMGELVTPTGAAIAAAIQTSDQLPETFKIVKIGIGTGKRDYACAGILRAMLIEPETKEKDEIWKLETNIDDCSGEVFGQLMERLFSAGARDVHYSPVFMKKNRPAYQLNVICREEQIEELEKIIFRETTTIGIRRVKMERTILKRQEEEICGWFGTAKVKVCSLPSGESRAYPEYESVKEICGKLDMAYLDVYQEIGKAWKNQHGK